MKTLYLKIDNSLYEIILSMLKGLPRNKIRIIEEDKHPPTADIMRYAGQLQWPVDGVEYQRKIRDEEWLLLEQATLLRRRCSPLFSLLTGKFSFQLSRRKEPGETR